MSLWFSYSRFRKDLSRSFICSHFLLLFSTRLMPGGSALSEIPSRQEGRITSGYLALHWVLPTMWMWVKKRNTCIVSIFSGSSYDFRNLNLKKDLIHITCLKKEASCPKFPNLGIKNNCNLGLFLHMYWKKTCNINFHSSLGNRDIYKCIFNPPFCLETEKCARKLRYFRNKRKTFHCSNSFAVLNRPGRVRASTESAPVHGGLGVAVL